MKFFHLSDLHLGKRVNEFSLIEDQTHILDRILDLVKEHAPDAVIIAGDVYDKPIPVVEAVTLLDSFLVSLHNLKTEIFMTSGNHDNAQRVAFAADLLKNSGVHVVTGYSGTMEPVAMHDEHGPVNVWMLPYMKPSLVHRFFPEAPMSTYTDALSAAISNAPVDKSVRNVLVAHQFVTGATTTESEELFAGGSENVDATVFDPFDYVALGHLHRPQSVSRQTVRYGGSPLKYSFSEADHNKSVTMLELGKKGSEASITFLPLVPLRDMRVLKGDYKTLMSRENYIGTNTDDYIQVVLTDEQEEPDALAKLRSVYGNIMRLEYDNPRTRAASTLEIGVTLQRRTPSQLFGELFEAQNGQPMSELQAEYVENLLGEIFGEAVYQ